MEFSQMAAVAIWRVNRQMEKKSSLFPLSHSPHFWNKTRMPIYTSLTQHSLGSNSKSNYGRERSIKIGKEEDKITILQMI